MAIKRSRERVERLLILLILGLTACGVTEVVARDERGRAILIRSPQPGAAELKNFVRSEGLQTVVSLRSPELEAGWYLEEAKCVKDLGLRWVHIPISSHAGPRPEQVRSFLHELDRCGGAVLVHCQGGLHRTGVMVAAWRILRQGWSPQRAIAEMEDRGFNWGWTDREGMKAWLMSLNAEFKEARPARQQNSEKNP